MSYDPTGIHKREWIYSTPISDTLRLHKINRWIHSIQILPSFIEGLVFLFGYAFNPVSIPLWLAVASLTGASPASFRNVVDNEGSEDLSTGARLFPPVFYFTTVLVTLLGTEVCKATFQATRPEAILSQEFRSSKVRRYGSLVASLKSKHSFPSGDSAQAANAVLFFVHYTLPTLSLAGKMDSLHAAILFKVLAFGVFYPGVAFARIFYHCHWIEDCFGGAVLALLLHQTIIPVVSDIVWVACGDYLPVFGGYR